MARSTRLVALAVCAVVVTGLLWGCDGGAPAADAVDSGVRLPADAAPPRPDARTPRPDAAPDARVPDDAAVAVPPDAGSPDAAPDARLEPAPDAGPASLRPRFDPAGGGFYDTPWPSDARLTAAGTPDLSLLQAHTPSFVRVLFEIQGRVAGFATMPVVYVAFEDSLAGVALPSPVESLAPDAVVQLLELGEGCGRRIPVEASLRLEAGRYVEADTLQAKNTVGTVLQPGRPHALVVLRGLGAGVGRPATPPEAFLAAWAGDGSRWGEALRPLRECAEAAGLDPAEVAMATVFTPQDPVAELQAMRDVVMDPAVESRPPLSMARDGVWSRRRMRLTTFTGLVEMPVFQGGAPPYTMEGGGLAFGEDGRPVIQRWEAVPFAVAMRDFDPPRPGPRPALVFIDGTGWEPWRHLHGQWMRDALDAGFVVFSFMPQFHGERAGVTGGPELATFNFLNPPAGRTNFRQQAVENGYFTRIIRERLVGWPGLPEIDASRIVYGGHSQGALAGALTAAVESEYAAYVFNGLSSYLTLTVLARKDLVDFELLVRGLVGDQSPLDLYSPALHILQLGSEAVDPHNFARLWRGSPARPQGSHVFVINGFTDDTTTPRGMDHLTISADLPTFDPPGWDIDPLGIGAPARVHAPVRGNTVSLSGAPLTIATYLDPTEGHFTVHRNGTLRQMSLRFWETALAGAVPLLQPSRELMCADGADDDADGAADCEDADCQAREPCRETVCDDGHDGDGDAAVDCADPDCAGRPGCQEADCTNGLDDDADGDVDCADRGCANREPCVEVLCRDGVDGDGDGEVDCADLDCARTEACREVHCGNGVDDDGDGLPDCADDECLRSLLCPEPACDDGSDEDGNGLADCADPRCAGQEACPALAELECGDGLDEDGDGAADCADPDCALAEHCRAEGCADGDLGSATGTGVFRGTLLGRPDAWDPGDCTALGSGKGAPDLALRWTAPADGVYVVSTLGSAADTVLTVFPDDCDRQRELACSDDLPGVTTSAVAIEIRAGQSVVLVVSSFAATSAGPVALHVYPRP